jgi:DNA-binding MarR family transcriptional regulator
MIILFPKKTDLEGLLRMSGSTDHIINLIERLGRFARSAQRCAGMKPAQWEALRFVSRANRYSRTPGALADFLSSTRGTVSQTLIALEKKGLISRKTNSGDARVKQLELTERGRDLTEHNPLHILEDAVSSVADETGLEQALEQVLKNLIRQNGNHQFGVNDHKEHAKGPHRCGLSGEPLDDLGSNLIYREHEVRAA